MKNLRSLCSAIALLAAGIFIVAPLKSSSPASEVIEAPKEISLSANDWLIGLIALAVILFTLIMVRIYNISRLTRSLSSTSGSNSKNA